MKEGKSMDDQFTTACSPENQEMVSPELIRSLGIPPAEIYASAENVIKLAKAAGEADGRGFVLLPFCHTVEAKALGADIKPADDTAGPRPGSYTLKGPEELAAAEIAKSPDAARLLEACAALAAEGRSVVYQLSGPISILSCMMPLNNFFKSWRKEPETAQRCLGAIGDMLLDYAREIRAAGVKYISYSDPAGNRDILGPKYSRQMAEEFTLPFLKRLAEACGEDTTVIICPLTAQALLSENLMAPAKGEETGRLCVGCVKRGGLPERRNFILV